jgi:hypothetical protein
LPGKFRLISVFCAKLIMIWEGSKMNSFKTLLATMSLLASTSAFATATLSSTSALKNKNTRLNFVCAMSVYDKKMGTITCEANESQFIDGGAAFGGYGTSIQMATGSQTMVFGAGFLVRDRTVEQNISVINTASGERLSSSTLNTNYGSITILENADVTVRMRCVESKKSGQNLKAKICSML